MRDFLQELRDNWNNSYWWADHQLILAVLVGTISLSFTILELYAKRKLAPEV